VAFERGQHGLPRLRRTARYPATRTITSAPTKATATGNPSPVEAGEASGDRVGTGDGPAAWLVAAAVAGAELGDPPGWALGDPDGLGPAVGAGVPVARAAGSKSADTERSDVIATVQNLSVPLQAPPQWANVDGSAKAAFSWIDAPYGSPAEQFEVGQSIRL